MPPNKSFSNYFKSTATILKENIPAAIVGFIIFLVALAYIAKYINKSSPVTLKLSNRIMKKNIVEKTQTIRQRIYVVRKNDNLWKIAEKEIGSGYNFVDIAKANKIKNPNIIEVGQKLIIPSVKPIKLNVPLKKTQPKIVKKITITGNKYTVVKGDHLWSIAVRAYGDGYKWVDIAKANKLLNPNLIHSGNVLILPR